MRLVGSADSGGYPTGCRGDSATVGSPGNTPLGSTDGLCRAYPLGQPAGAYAGRPFCDPRTSCGDTNGSTLHVAKQVRGIQNPQSCRQAHRKSHLSGAPLLASIPAERIAFRPVRVIAGVQMVVHYDEGIRSLSLSEARRQLRLGKSPCHRGLATGAKEIRRRCIGEVNRRCFSIGGI